MIETPTIVNDVIQIVVEHQVGGKRKYAIVANRMRVGDANGVPLPAPVAEAIDPILLSMLLSEANKVHLEGFLKRARAAMAGQDPDTGGSPHD